MAVAVAVGGVEEGERERAVVEGVGGEVGAFGGQHLEVFGRERGAQLVERAGAHVPLTLAAEYPQHRAQRLLRRRVTKEALVLSPTTAGFLPPSASRGGTSRRRRLYVPRPEREDEPRGLVGAVGAARPLARPPALAVAAGGAAVAEHELLEEEHDLRRLERSVGRNVGELDDLEEG